jgi:hypothetical protein
VLALLYGLRKEDIIEAVDGKIIYDTVEISLNLRKKITDKIIMGVNRLIDMDDT